KEVLHRRDHDPLLHEGRGITYLRHVGACRLDLEVPEVRATKPDAGILWSRDQSHVHGIPRVEPDSLQTDPVSQSALILKHERTPKPTKYYLKTRSATQLKHYI